MSFKTVLVTAGVGRESSGVDRAAGVAEALDAHLSVLAIGIAPPPPSSPYGVVSSDIWAAEIQDGQAEAQAFAREIAGRMRARGLSASVLPQFVDRATVPTIVARSARYADVTLIMPEEEEADRLRPWIINGALFESGRPVVVMPEEETRFPQSKRVMIAWDASVEASKAVRDAVGLMKRAEAIDAVLIDPVPSFEGHGPEPGADLATYLGRHGIAATIHRLPREGRDVSDILQRTAVDLDADLMVMGGFGHSRLRQRIFGGTTTSTLKGTRLPVLMAH